MSNTIPSNYDPIASIGGVEVNSDLSAEYAAAIQGSISSFNKTEILTRHVSSSTASIRLDQTSHIIIADLVVGIAIVGAVQ